MLNEDKIPACVVCDTRAKYKELVKNYNEIVSAHNALVEDANALLKLLEDVTKGLRVYVMSDSLIHPSQVNTVRLIDVNEPHVALNEGRNFAAHFNNEIVELLIQIQQGARPNNVYKAWLDKCIKIHKQYEGGKI